MIGYTTNKNDFYKGNYITHKTKSAVTRSGGNYLHYELFNSLLTGSIYNETLKMYHHDCRAGYSILFLYPVRIQILLSLIFYRAELDSSVEYNEYIIKPNLVDPINNLLLINKITRNTISKSVIRELRLLDENFVLSSSFLQPLLNQLNIKTSFDFNGDSLETQLKKTFLLTNNNFSVNEEFIKISSSNNRSLASIYVCKQLNYKPVSINIINQAIEQWTQENLST